MLYDNASNGSELCWRRIRLATRIAVSYESNLGAHEWPSGGQCDSYWQSH